MTSSINTNQGAYVALQSLNSTNSALATTQKQIATGYRVSDATDDGGAFAVAQKVRSDVGALTSVNQQLGNASGLVTTALSSLTSISTTLGKAKGLLVSIADQSTTSDQRSQYVASFKALVLSVANATDGSTYNGQSLLGKASGTVAPAAAGVSVINNESGATSTISSEDNSTTAATLASLIGATFSRDAAGVDTFTAGTDTAAQTAASTALSATTGATSFAALQTTNSNQLNQAGADSNYLSSQVTFNSNKIDSLNSGLGALVDADLSQESAQLQSLQIKQQLGTQALSIANQAPSSLLSLFRG